MFKEILQVDDRFTVRCAEEMDQVFFWLMRKHIDDIDSDVMANIWIAAGHHICKMYRSRIRSREGVG